MSTINTQQSSRFCFCFPHSTRLDSIRSRQTRQTRQDSPMIIAKYLDRNTVCNPSPGQQPDLKQCPPPPLSNLCNATPFYLFTTDLQIKLGTWLLPNFMRPATYISVYMTCQSPVGTRATGHDHQLDMRQWIHHSVLLSNVYSKLQTAADMLGISYLVTHQFESSLTTIFPPVHPLVST